MKNSITPKQIKQNNRNLIYQYIYHNAKVSQQDICFALRLSRPTVTTNLNLLEQDGLIQKDGQISTESVGRKAAAYSIITNYRVGIGVEILKNEVKLILIDLYGQKIDRLAFQIDFSNEDTYFKTVCDKLIEFKNSLNIDDSQILGVGFAMQALISPDKKTVIYGKILDCNGLSIEAFAKHLPYACSFIHDAESAAVAEMWLSPELKDAFYLSLSKHLGAAIICDGRILNGKHGHSSTIEHIQIDSDGIQCYCGNKGCLETVCSIEALLSDDGQLENFFEHLHQNDAAYTARWDNYLTNLAKAINMLHLIYDTDFILGGYLAPFIQNNDIEILYAKVSEMTPFPESKDFIMLSKMPKHNITIGSALPYIQDFLLA